MSIRGDTLHINSLDFNVLVEGEGPDVLLIHGFPDSNSVWRNQIPALVEAGFRVIAPDLRGFGETTAPTHVTEYRIDRYVADLVAVLDELKIEKARVVGHDWGAAVGWQLSMQQAARVDRYAALSVGHPSAYARDGIEGKLRAYYIGFFQVRGVAENAVAANDWWLWRRMLRYDREMDTWKADLSRPGRLTAAINIYRANPTMLVAHDWPKVTVPVLGIWGEGDVALVEGQMIDSEKYVTGPWRYERVGGGTHWVQLEAPEKTNALLLDFLA